MVVVDKIEKPRSVLGWVVSFRKSRHKAVTRASCRRDNPADHLKVKESQRDVSERCSRADHCESAVTGNLKSVGDRGVKSEVRKQRWVKRYHIAIHGNVGAYGRTLDIEERLIDDSKKQRGQRAADRRLDRGVS